MDGWHSDCRGDAKAFTAFLADYAKLNVIPKRLVVRDGVGDSYLLNSNSDVAKRGESSMQWSFMVQLKPHLRPFAQRRRAARRDDAKQSPPVHLDVYASDHLRWEDVKVPAGIVVIDNRLESKGFTLKDGNVLTSTVTDLATQKPIAGTVQLQRIEDRKEGGRIYPVVAEASTNDQGTWVLKQTPPGWYRVVVQAKGYAPRVVNYERLKDQPRLYLCHGGLAPAAVVFGSVVDEAGMPIEGVAVKLSDVVSVAGGRYDSPSNYSATTDDKGQFRFEQVPVGEATVLVKQNGYSRPSPGQPISMPVGGLELRMTKGK